MKFKTTAKAIRENGGRIIAIGYCSAEWLLKGYDPIAYTCGVYGWNFDVYNVEGVTICTGYRGMPGKRVDYDKLTAAEVAAQKIWCNYKIPYEDRKAKVTALLHEVIEAVTDR